MTIIEAIRKLFWPDSPTKAPATTPRGYALCIGVNRVDPDHYDGWSGPLNACENDARHMSHMLEQKGFTTQILLTRNATRRNVFNAIGELARVAVCGDIVVITNSSHGGQVPDYDGNEADGMDETICMYDGQIIDDELDAAWTTFAPGVRLVFVSDSCHSGTMARLFGQSAVLSQTGSRAMPADIAHRTAYKNEAQYKAIAMACKAMYEKAKLHAHLLAFGACQDNQTAMDGAVNGAFTGALLQVLKHYPNESMGRMIQRVRQALPPTQTPKYTFGGPRLSSFESAPCFAIQ